MSRTTEAPETGFLEVYCDCGMTSDFTTSTAPASWRQTPDSPASTDGFRVVTAGAESEPETRQNHEPRVCAALGAAVPEEASGARGQEKRWLGLVPGHLGRGGGRSAGAQGLVLQSHIPGSWSGRRSGGRQGRTAGPGDRQAGPGAAAGAQQRADDLTAELLAVPGQRSPRASKTYKLPRQRSEGSAKSPGLPERQDTQLRESLRPGAGRENRAPEQPVSVCGSDGDALLGPKRGLAGRPFPGFSIGKLSPLL